MMQLMMGLMGIDATAGAPPSDEEAASRSAEPTSAPKPREPEPEPEAPKEKSDEEKTREESDAHKATGNAEYKKRNFEVALGHYDKAFETDPTNIAVLTNKAGKFFFKSLMHLFLFMVE